MRGGVLRSQRGGPQTGEPAPRGFPGLLKNVETGLERGLGEKNRSEGKKKRLELFSSRRLGSPPPELPNHEMDVKEGIISCKRHFGNGGISAGSRWGFLRPSAGANSKLLLLLPALATIGSGPDLRSRGGDGPVVRVGELDGYDIAGRPRIRREEDLLPSGSRVVGVIEHRIRATGPDLRTDCGYRTEHELSRSLLQIFFLPIAPSLLCCLSHWKS